MTTKLSARQQRILERLDGYGDDRVVHQLPSVPDETGHVLCPDSMWWLQPPQLGGLPHKSSVHALLRKGYLASSIEPVSSRYDTECELARFHIRIGYRVYAITARGRNALHWVMREEMGPARKPELVK